MQQTESLTWSFKREELENEGVWQLSAYEGVLSPNSTMVSSAHQPLDSSRDV
jgi:hypothetical protein